MNKFLIFSTVLMMVVLMSSVKVNADQVTLTGSNIRLDDALFSGCFHNAFEGLVMTNDDGSVKRGRQGIQRTKGVLVGKGSDYSEMTCRFHLKSVPAGKAQLVLNGIDDSFDEPNKLRVLLNDKELHVGPMFKNNDISATRNRRYFIGWSEKVLSIPAGALKQGENTLRIENTEPLFESSHWTYAAIDFAELRFEKDAQVKVDRPAAPPYYYGLSEGVEVNIWPSINLGRICLLVGADLQFNFYTTFPEDFTPIKGNVRSGRAPVTLHIETDGHLDILYDKASLKRESLKDGVSHYALNFDMKVVGTGTTPHPAQGVNLFIRATKPFENAQLRAWYTVGDHRGQVREYPLRGVATPTDAAPDTGFELSMWSGQMPGEASRAGDYVKMMRRMGFSRMFGGSDEAQNQMLSEHGFDVYPRFGWFGHSFRVTDETSQFAAITPDGKKMPKDFCPLAILENPDHPQLGRHFQHARKAAKDPKITGLCVDFECAPVWCYCERCLAMFKEETGITASPTQVARDGEYEEVYKQFGRRRNRDLLNKVRQIMKEVNPSLKYAALASAADMPAYWWDGRRSGRHSLRELATFSDEIATSGYFYGFLGGLKSVRPIIRTTKQFALESDRDVDVSMISPIATTISETPRYRGATMGPDLLRLEMLLIGTAKGRGLSVFRGDCFDGEHFLACRQAIEELELLKPYIASNTDRSYEVIAEPVGNIERRTSLSVSQNLLARMPWHPDIAYQYEAVHYTRDYLGEDRVVILFNFLDQPLPMRFKLLGLFDDAYRLSDLKTGKPLGQFKRLEMEAGAPQVEVPARGCVFVRIESVGS